MFNSSKKSVTNQQFTDIDTKSASQGSNVVGGNLTVVDGGATMAALNMGGGVVSDAFQYAGHMGNLTTGAAVDLGEAAINSGRSTVAAAVEMSKYSADRAADNVAQVGAVLQKSTSDALSFAAMASRSDGAMNTETLIKWGFGGLVLVAIFLRMKG
jgi:hypothetical protein